MNHEATFSPRSCKGRKSPRISDFDAGCWLAEHGMSFLCSHHGNFMQTSTIYLCFFDFSRKLRERVLLKNSCSIDHQHDKTIADHQPLTTANDKTIADHQPLTTANDKNDKTIADHQPLTTANDTTMRRSAEKIC